MIAYLAFLVLAATAPVGGRDAQMKCASVLEDQAAKLRAHRHMLLADAEYAESHNNEMSPDMMQRYISWYRDRVAEGAKYPDLTSAILSASERHQRQRSIIDFLDYEKREREVFDLEVRAALIEACPWKTADIKAKSWPEGL